MIKSKQWIFALALLLGLSMAAVACAQAPVFAGDSSAPIIAIDPIVEPTLPPEGFDEQEPFPVQTDGIITLESRRTYEGEITKSTSAGWMPLKWTVGVAYAESIELLGPLRHVHVSVSEDNPDRAKIISQDYKYNAAEDGRSAELELILTVSVDGQLYSVQERFTLYPEGEGMRAVNEKDTDK